MYHILYVIYYILHIMYILYLNKVFAIIITIININSNVIVTIITKDFSLTRHIKSRF